MADQKIIKKILQEQEKKIPHIDVTQQVMHRIALQQERKNRFYQTIGLIVAFGLIAWMYMAIKPYFQIFKSQPLHQFISLPYIFCYMIVILAFLFFFYDDRSTASS